MLDLSHLFSKQKPLVGLDIGSSSLKLVELSETKHGYVLTNFFQLPLPRGVIENGIPAEEQELVGHIKELFRLAKCRTKNVATSLSGHGVIIKKVTLSNMGEEELRELIHDEASKYLPFDEKEEISFDFQILGANDYNPNLMEVLLVAAKKDVVDTYRRIITAAGLVPLIMDVDSFALETMYEENYDFDDRDIAVLVNIGASITNINVVKNGGSIFTRDFPLGGNAVTEAIQKLLNIGFEEAEKIKTEGPSKKLEEVGQDVLSLSEEICLEIERSVDYFHSTFGGGDIKQVLLAGGGAKTPGLAEELSRRLNIDAEIVNPFRKIGIDKKLMTEAIQDIGPIAAVAVGLALRRLGDR